MYLTRFFTSRSALYIWFTAALFVGRVIFFANTYGAVEHDSGWYLGVAKNLALRGIYASYTNTIRGDKIGANPSIHGRFSVQDEQGFSYFPAGVTVGPGYIVPEALIIKIFGSGHWQYRLWPLLTFACLLYILFFAIHRIGGIFSLIIFQIWLWAVPQLTTTFAYEAYSEHIALLFLLLSILLLYKALHKQKSYGNMFLAGLFFALSVLTKNLFLLTGVAFIPPFLWELYTNRRKLIAMLLPWVLFIVGGLLPIFIFELYLYVFLLNHFGLQAWQAVNEDMRLTFQVGGSGINSLRNFDWDFISKKFAIWKDVGISQTFLPWLLFLISPLILIYQIVKRYRLLVIIIYVAALSSFAWFVFISPAGWARHAWHSLILAMILISISLGIILGKTRKNRTIQAFLVIVYIAIGLGVTRPASMDTKPFLDGETLVTWRNNRYIRGLEGFPSTPILSLTDQKNMVDYFDKHIQSSDRVYYVGWFLNAELPPLVDKVFYTLDRYLQVDQFKSKKGKSYVIIGPYQQGPYSFMPPAYVGQKISQLCEQVVYKNPSYVLCSLKTNLVYINNAYK